MKFSEGFDPQVNESRLTYLALLCLCSVLGPRDSHQQNSLTIKELPVWRKERQTLRTSQYHRVHLRTKAAQDILGAQKRSPKPAWG